MKETLTAQCFKRKKNVQINFPIGQLFFGAGGTIEFRSATASEAEAWARKNAAASVAEGSFRGSQRAWIQSRSGKVGSYRKRALGQSTPYKNGKNAAGSDKVQGGPNGGKDNFAVLSDFLRS